MYLIKMRLHPSLSFILTIAAILIFPATSISANLSGDRIAVIIEALPPAPDGGESERLSFALGLALRNYVDYYLSRSNLDFQLFQTEFSPPKSELLAAIGDSGFVNIVTLKPSGKFATTRVPMLSRSRRVYYEKVSGQLSLQIQYRRIELKNDKWVKSGIGNIKVKPKRPWLIPPVGLNERRVDSMVAVTPEPVEFVIMRAVGKLFKRLKFHGKSDNKNDDFDRRAITTLVVVDSLIEQDNKNWRQSTDDMLKYLDKLLADQFGIGIEISGLEVARLGSNRLEPLSKSFARFKKNYPFEKMGVTLGIHAELHPINFFRLREFDAVGLSERGQGQLLVKEFPPTRDDLEDWRPFLTARSCIHELGHVYGAIHVSDLKSIMNHSATWLSTFRFDPLNREIVRAATSGELDVSDNFTYAKFLADAIESSNYYLADFPPMFFHLLGDTKQIFDGRQKKKARIKELFRLAADGYGALVSRKLDKAADYFRRAILLAPNQAALHYYLSLCTGGSKSENSLKRAASLGYELAREQFRQQR